MQGLIPKFSRNSTNPINVLVMKNKCFSAPLKNCTKTVHHQIVNKHPPHAVSYGQNWAFVLPRPSLSADLHIFSLFFWKSCHIIRLWPIALGFFVRVESTYSGPREKDTSQSSKWQKFGERACRSSLCDMENNLSFNHVL